MEVGESPQRVARARRGRNNFDGLRLVASCAVVWNHVAIDPAGNTGVRLAMFFAISGFLVAGSWLADPRALRFLARRFLRIWPAYAVMVVVCAGASWLFPAPDMPEISRMASAFYLTNLWMPGFDWGFFPGHAPWMNQSLWMLPYEIDQYLAFVLVALCGRHLRVALASALILLAMQVPQTTAAAGGLFECWSAYFGGFFAFGVLMRDVPWFRKTTTVATCVACGVVLLVAGSRSAGLLLIIPPGAVWIGERSWPVLRSAARFGDLSLGVFLWSFPIQQVTHLWLAPQTPVALQFLVIMAQAIPIAWLSSRYVEQPALRRKPRAFAEGVRAEGPPSRSPLPLALVAAK